MTRNSREEHKYMLEGSVQRVGETPTSVPFDASQNTFTTSVPREVDPACPRARLFEQLLPERGPISAHQPACPDGNTERSLVQLPSLGFVAHLRQDLPSFRQSKGNL